MYFELGILWPIKLVEINIEENQFVQIAVIKKKKTFSDIFQENC